MEINALVSVIVPIYNKAPYIEKCLDDICNQTYGDLEIICINDGSTDGSGEIVKSYMKKDSRFRYLEQKNQGVSAARNRGLELAKGEYISFIDCDDGLERDMYDFLLKLLKKYEADIAHCGYKKIYLDGSSIEIGDSTERLVQSQNEALACLVGGKYFTGSLCTKLYKANLFENVRFDEQLRINEDLYVNYKVFNKAKVIVFSGATKYKYFEREESSATRIKNKKKVLDALKVAEYIYEDSKENDTLKCIAARKFFIALTNTYRSLIFYPSNDQDKIKREICTKIEEIRPLCRDISLKYKFNFKFMKYLPVFYKFLYQIYDLLRNPNWDV